MGDFNEIVNLSEKKKGASIHPRGQMEEFLYALEDAQLNDLGFKGPKFTWNNGRPERDHTIERLDKAVANLEWFDMWRDASVEVNGCCSSDHLPLLLILNAKRACSWNKWWPFRYEAGWSKEWGL